MSDFVEVFKMVLENPSPLVICVVVSVLVIYKSRDLLDIFFQLKDINKKRIIQRLEETKTLSEKNYLDSSLNRNYDRLCEEAQIHAIIGCQDCSKEMAQYIMSRKNISGTIRIYHQVKDRIKIKAGEVVPCKIRSEKRIKTYKFLGWLTYWILGCIGTLFLTFSIKTNIWNGVFIYASLLIVGLVIVIQSVKIDLAKLFCELEPMDESTSTELGNSNKAA